MHLFIFEVCQPHRVASSSISRGNAPRSRASELMQHEPAIFHAIFIVRDDITYTTFPAYFRKQYLSWTSRALKFHARYVNFHRDATY